MQRFSAWLLLIMCMAGCSRKVTATPTPGTVVPYQAPTPTQTATLLPVLTGVLSPTPTSITYIVVQGDTFSSIAQRNGITLEALLAANPGISSSALSIGAKLVIPAGNQVPTEPNPTPASLPVRQARCWAETTGELWCFALVQNGYAEILENISAQFSLVDAGGKEIASQVAWGLLDILPPGAAMPLAVHFAPPVQADVGVRVQVLTANRLLPGDTRYLPVSLENILVAIDSSGRTANLSGQVLLGKGTANTLWLLANAYDGAGDVVGVRRWESTSALAANTPLSFNFTVYSLGPAIVRVEFLAEAQP